MSYQLKRQTKRCQQKSLRNQRGIVIVVALFIVALVATMAVAMMARLERDTLRTRLILRDTQAEFYAQGGIAWAIMQLRDDNDQQKPDRLVDVIPIHSPVQKINGYEISSTIEDMQARFNLNNLSDQEAQTGMKSLLKTVAPKLSSEAIQSIVRALSSWIALGAAEPDLDNFYLQHAPAYRAAHRLMQHPSELKLVKGMTPALYNALQPYVTALPGTVAVNVQTAPAPVLMTLSPTLTVAGAQAILAARAQTPFVTPQAFTKLDVVKNATIPEGKITVVSSYFLVTTKVTIENQHLVIYTLMERTTKDRKAQIRILWQSKGIE